MSSKQSPVRPLIAESLKDEVPEMFLLGFQESPFHKNLGLEFALLEDYTVVVRLRKSQQLLGNVMRNMMHGGVISAAFDSAGGAVCMVNMYRKFQHLSGEERAKKLVRICTIDLTVNYLAPAKDEEFDLSARIVKLGGTIAHVAMEMHDMSGKLIATASGNFMV